MPLPREAAGLFADVQTADMDARGYSCQADAGHDVPGSWVMDPDGAGFRLFTGPAHFKRALELAMVLSEAYWKGFRDHERGVPAP